MSNWENSLRLLDIKNLYSVVSTRLFPTFVASESILNKRSAMDLFSEDLDIIRVQLAHHKLISSKALVKHLSKKDKLLDQFWGEYSTDIKSISLKRKYNVSVAGSEELGNSRQTKDDGALQEVEK
ncbi:hypothetical protein INT47_011972 [Mucor saturninus]|uniref:Uncharacterized protein n=1 Tax=Mucor saturninus TaxID=64648 RepID=A0A8H7R581_9FUNG|nr:hypothetical protein INT47_011972 [Mucor saturninus]